MRLLAAVVAVTIGLCVLAVFGGRGDPSAFGSDAGTGWPGGQDQPEPTVTPTRPVEPPCPAKGAPGHLMWHYEADKVIGNSPAVGSHGAYFGTGTWPAAIFAVDCDGHARWRFDYEAVAAVMSSHTRDAKEGTNAFLEKRKAEFKGY